MGHSYDIYEYAYTRMTLAGLTPIDACMIINAFKVIKSDETHRVLIRLAEIIANPDNFMNLRVHVLPEEKQELSDKFKPV